MLWTHRNFEQLAIESRAHRDRWPFHRFLARARIRVAQFRPEPPPALDSKEWVADYNEIKTYGSKTSTKRTPQQTETARFWLMVGPQAYHPFARQIVKAKQMSVSDSARFMTLVSLSLNDALIAVFDAKYHYNF